MRLKKSKDEKYKDFLEFLLKIGRGTYPKKFKDDKYTIELPKDLINLTKTQSELIEEVYPYFVENYDNVEWITERCILTPTNQMANKINAKLLDKISGETKTYKSIDTCEDENLSLRFPTEFLNSVEQSGLPYH